MINSRDAIWVTFDTNAYSVVARPQVRRLFSKLWPLNRARLTSIRDRLCWWYVNWCVRSGRVIAAIPEGCLKAEIVPNVDRVALLFSIGTSAAKNLPAIPPIRQEIMRAAFDVGFVVLHSPRIGWGASVEIDRAQWAPDARFDIATRQERESQFVRRFNNYPLEVLRAYGERLSAAHALSSLPQNLHLAQAASLSGITLDRYLWCEGLMAEEKAPRVEASVKVFQQKVRNMLADWVDFDVAAAHYAYGFDILCSQESGRSSTSIFSSARSQTLTTDFNIYVLNIVGLTKLCLRRYWFSLTRWD
jgi:hypothetical protein